MNQLGNTAVREGFEEAVDILLGNYRTYAGISSNTVQGRSIAIMVIDYLNGKVSQRILVGVPFKLINRFMFEFYFQSGEFAADAGGIWEFLKDSLVQLLGTFGGAVAALYLYRLQNKDKLNDEQQARDLKDLDNVSYLFYLIEKSVECLRAYSMGYSEIMREIDSQLLDFPGLIIARSTNEMDRLINKIDLKEYYHSYQNIARKNNFKGTAKSFENGISAISISFDKIENDKKMLIEYRAEFLESKKFLNKIMQDVYIEIEALYKDKPDDMINTSLKRVKDALSNAEFENLLIYQTSMKEFLERTLVISGKSTAISKNTQLTKIISLSVAGLHEYRSIADKMDTLRKYIESTIKTYNREVASIESRFADFQSFITKLHSNAKNP